ncbi:MAG: glycosyltransferase family 2 protein [Elusimicrobiales bacterium]|nr:glycosyltransferase family 2 protein [Elusimicrobiales bacterium]
MPKTVIVMPAYNAAATLKNTLRDLPREYFADAILVDDASSDDTVKVAEELGLRVVRRDRNGGYGANQKTCYRLALEAGADIVVMLHPDYQYNPKIVPHMVWLIEEGICDVVLGNRVRTRREALAGDMPLYKYAANRFLSLLCNVVTGENLGEWHSGLRAYSAKALSAIPWETNSDDFVFDMQFLAQASFFGLRMGDVPVETRYFKEASSINFRRSTVYGLLTLWTMLRFFLARLGLRGRLFSAAA